MCDGWENVRGNQFDDKGVKELIKYLRRPGGNEEGVPIPAAAITRIQVACFAATYCEMVGRDINAQSMAWTRIKQFKDLITINDEYSEPEALKAPIKNSKIVEWTESLEEYLRSIQGVRRVPLSYLIRERVEPAQIEAYPNNHTFPYSPSYTSFTKV